MNDLDQALEDGFKAMQDDEVIEPWEEENELGYTKEREETE